MAEFILISRVGAGSFMLRGSPWVRCHFLRSVLTRPLKIWARGRGRFDEMKEIVEVEVELVEEPKWTEVGFSFPSLPVPPVPTGRCETGKPNYKVTHYVFGHYL